MWTAEHRRNATRKGLRYPSDLTDDEWRLVEPFIPPARHGGRKRHVNVREVLNSIFYVLASGCQWSALPKDLAPKSTAHDYFIMLDRRGALRRIHEALYIAAREQTGKEASPTTAIIDSQAPGLLKRMARPVSKWFVSSDLYNLPKRIRPFSFAVGQDGDRAS